MRKLIYSCDWPRNKETAWSGTDMAIRKRLDNYFDVTDFDYGISRPYTFMTKVINKLFHKKMDVSRHYTKEFDRKHKDENIIFQFGEVPFATNAKNKHFIYQDLSWNNVRDLKDSDKEIFEISSYKDYDDATLKRNVDRQNSFYSKDNVYCLTMGKWLAKYFIEVLHIPQERVCFCGGGSNIDVSKIDMSKKTGNKFLFVGKDFERKNGPLVVEAFKKLHNDNPQYELYIAGPKGMNIEGEGIHNLGLLSFEQLVEYFNLCDVFVMPSLFEAYGLVFNEALSFGLPCIGNNSYEMPYLIAEGKDGYLLRNNSSDELSQLMKKTIEDKGMIEYVKNNNEHYVKECSWDTVVERMTNFINSKCK